MIKVKFDKYLEITKEYFPKSILNKSRDISVRESHAEGFIFDIAQIKYDSEKNLLVLTEDYSFKLKDMGPVKKLDDLALNLDKYLSKGTAEYIQPKQVLHIRLLDRNKIQ